MIVRRLAALVLAALVALAAACGDDGPGAGTDGGTTRVDLVLDWFPNADHAGVYGAVGEGFFADRGLDVRPTVPSDPAAALKEVGAGRADFAVSYEPEVLLARGEGVPVVAVGALVTRPLNSIIVREDSGITRPRDLEGRTVGSAGLPLERPLLDTVVRADGGDPSRVRVRNVGYNLSPALASGRVDAVVGAYWNIELVELEAQGIEARAFRVDDHGVPPFDELVLVTSDRLIAERPQVVRDMLAALRRGQDWAAADHAGAVDHLLDANPDLERDIVREQVRLTAPLLSPDDRETLDMEPERWREFARWMRAAGLLERPVDVDAAMTTDFLPPRRG